MVGKIGKFKIGDQEYRFTIGEKSTVVNFPCNKTVLIFNDNILTYCKKYTLKKKYIKKFVIDNCL